MKKEKSESTEVPYHAIEVKPGGKVEVLSEGGFSTKKPFPTEPGTYQLRLVRRVWSSDAEHGAWIPQSEWASGVVKPEDWPSTHELPEGGLSR